MRKTDQQEAIKLCATAVCQSRVVMPGIREFVVYRTEGGEKIASARSAVLAWKKARMALLLEASQRRS